MKTTNALALLIIVGALGVSQMAYADSSTLSVLPASLNSTIGASFTVTVQLNPANNTVCVAKGTLLFSNVTCQSITIADGVTAQTAPTCASPNFIIGIPKCATTIQNLFSVSVKGNQDGQGNISFTGVKIIGAGADVPFTSQAGVYTIVAPQTPPQVTAPAPKPTQQTAAPTPTTTQQTVKQSVEELATAETPVITQETNFSQPAALKETTGLGGLLAWLGANFWWVLLLTLLAAAAYYYYIKNTAKSA